MDSLALSRTGTAPDFLSGDTFVELFCPQVVQSLYRRFGPAPTELDVTYRRAMHHRLALAYLGCSVLAFTAVLYMMYTNDDVESEEHHIRTVANVIHPSMIPQTVRHTRIEGFTVVSNKDVAHDVYEYHKKRIGAEAMEDITRMNKSSQFGGLVKRRYRPPKEEIQEYSDIESDKRAGEVKIE